jgi:hypothetical protein
LTSQRIKPAAAPEAQYLSKSHCRSCRQPSLIIS